MISRLATFTALGLAAASATFPVLAQQGISDTEIVIGDITPLTGPSALLGVAQNLGVKVAVAEANAIRRFVLLEKELDHDDGELTATQKVRRNLINKKFERELALIYEGA